MTKKWDLEISNAETELKIGIYAKIWAKQVLLKIFDYGQSQRSTVKVNGQSQRSTADVCWRGSVMSPKADVAGRDTAAGACGACGAWVRVVWCVGAGGRYWQRVERVLVRQKLQAARGGACDAVSSRSWLGFARDWLLCLSMLFFGSWMHRTLISECCNTVGVTVMACFWQWQLDEGEGNGRTSEMSTGTRKSEEWLWYHVNNIKWERKTK